MANDWVNHVKHYAATHGITYGEALKKAKASYTKSPRKMKGGQTLRDWGLQQYNTHVPEDYHEGIESLGRAASRQMGFGIFDDIGRAFQPVRNLIKPVKNIGRRLIQREVDTAKAIASDPRTKALAKQVAKQILQTGVDSAGPAAAAAAAASGNPELAPAAAFLGRQLAMQAQPYGDSYIDGLGLRKRRTRKGRALYPAGSYGP
jgi:hypothetical protein